MAVPWELGLKTTTGHYTTNNGPEEPGLHWKKRDRCGRFFGLQARSQCKKATLPFTYDCRLVVFAETPYLRLALRLINTSGQQVTMEEAWVRAAFNLKGERLETAFGIDGKAPKTATLRGNGWAGVQVDFPQPEPMGWSLRRRSTGDSPAGWVALTGSEGGIGLGVKAFRQQYPKGLKANGAGQIRLNFSPLPD